MRRRPFRGLWLRPTLRLGAGGQLLLSVLLGVGLALFFIHRFDAALRPHLIAAAQARIQNELTLAADRAVAQALTEQPVLSDGAGLQRSGEEGETLTISADPVRLNLLRSAVLDDIIQQVETLDSRSLGVPLGHLTGLDLLSAWGPSLPVQVLSVASAEGTYHSEFLSAGINQTLHRLTLDVDVTVRLLLPGGIAETRCSAPVCVSETVIVGQVPQTYLNWNQ